MSAMGVLGLIWLAFAMVTVAIAAKQKLKLPLVAWVVAGVLLGPLSLFWVAVAVGQKRRLPSYDDGSSPYGGGASLSGGFGG